MTVRELIQHLQKFGPDLPVFVKGYEWGWQDPLDPKLTRVQLNKNTPAGIGGPHEEVDATDEAFEKRWAAEVGDPEPVFVDAVLLPR